MQGYMAHKYSILLNTAILLSWFIAPIYIFKSSCFPHPWQHLVLPDVQQLATQMSIIWYLFVGWTAFLKWGKMHIISYVYGLWVSSGNCPFNSLPIFLMHCFFIILLICSITNILYILGTNHLQFCVLQTSPNLCFLLIPIFLLWLVFYSQSLYFIT